MTDIMQIRSDVYDELFDMLLLPYTTAESVNDRAKRTTEHVIKHCQVAATRQLLHTATEAMGIYGNRIDNAIAYLHGLTIFGTQEQRDNIGKAIEILEGKV